MSTNVMHGVRIVDFSTNLPGPFGTQVLADFGADVIMVEPLSGEPARSKSEGMFYAGHRNRRAIALDLKSESGREAALRLIETSDIIVESFRPGTMDRLGLGFERVQALKPSIIYCSMSGYGQIGPLREAGGHDINYLAMSGALEYSGHWNKAPGRSGIPVVDLASSLYLAISMLAALRAVEQDGNGVRIDLSMTDVAMALAASRSGPKLDLANDAQEHLWPTNDLFETADGTVLAVGAIEEHFWQNLRAVLATVGPDLLDCRFDTEPSRREHGDELQVLLRRTFAQRTASEWLTLLEDCDTTVSPVISMGEASRSDTVRIRGLVQQIDGVRHVMQPFLWNGEQAGSLRGAGPALGAQTEEILAELGLADPVDEPPASGE